MASLLRAVLDADEDVAGYEVAVDEASLVGVWHRAADLEEQVQPLRGAEVFLVAVGGDRDATHQFHDEQRPALAALVSSKLPPSKSLLTSIASAILRPGGALGLPPG